MKFIATFTTLVFSSILLSSCGSGSGGGDGVPSTRRPKTLDGLVLTIAGRGNFEFIRSAGSPPALLSGDVETGTFIYNLTGLNRAALDNLVGSLTNVTFPNGVATATYTYRAINANQAVLTLTGVGQFGGAPTGTLLPNPSNMILFTSDSDGNVNNTVEIDISFSTNGTTIQTEISTMFQVGSISPFDRVRAPMVIVLKGGGLVPENYNPVLDPLRPSLIAPVSLGATRIDFTNTGLADPNFDFSIQFIADAVGLPTNPPTEVGTGLLREAGAVVDDAINYTWQRIPGTDSGRLVVSGAGSTFDGGYTLDYVSSDQGSYIGEVDAGTPDINEVIGTFLKN